MSTVGLIDYGAGNFTSVMNALQHLELDVVPISSPMDFRLATHLILPGVGAFVSVMQRLEATGLIQPLTEEVTVRRKPFLGICVGMQVLADIGYEFETCRGLGFVPGVCAEIGARAYGLRMPHIGWNQVTLQRDSPLVKNLESSSSFYFVHSYQLRPSDASTVLMTCEYGNTVVAAVQRDNIFGVQFHPEKSQQAGLQLLKNFASL